MWPGRVTRCVADLNLETCRLKRARYQALEAEGLGDWPDGERAGCYRRFTSVTIRLSSMSFLEAAMSLL